MMNVFLVGSTGSTHLAESFGRAATSLGVVKSLCDIRIAECSWPLVNKISWRLWDKKPPFVHRLEAEIIGRRETWEGSAVITTGLAPVKGELVRYLKRRGAICMHFASDDPWNPHQWARWYHDALGEYDIVFSPRRSNVADLRLLGCAAVHYLPFGYDPTLFPESAPGVWCGTEPEVLFVGGADSARAAFFRELAQEGFRATLVGGYWNRFRDLAGQAVGVRPPIDVHALTLKARVNVVLTRRVNRDGHTMRSFEAGAIGGCVAVEDTEEHRDIFGADGVAVRYFRTATEAATVCRELVAAEQERKRLAAAVRSRIRGAPNTYADRLRHMLLAAANVNRESRVAV